MIYYRSLSRGARSLSRAALEAATVAPVPDLKRDAMVRKGEAGVQNHVGMTSEMAASINSWADILVPDPECRRTLITPGAPRARETSLATVGILVRVPRGMRQGTSANCTLACSALAHDYVPQRPRKQETHARVQGHPRYERRRGCTAL